MASRTGSDKRKTVSALQVFDITLTQCFDGDLRVPGAGESKVGQTVTLVTVGNDDWPVTALLGPGEVLIVAPRRLAMALWPTSRACRQLLEKGRGSLQLVADGRYYQLKLQVTRSLETADLIFVETMLIEGEAQSVPYATLTSGIVYTLAEPGTTLDRWADQVARLRRFTHEV